MPTMENVLRPVLCAWSGVDGVLGGDSGGFPESASVLHFHGPVCFRGTIPHLAKPSLQSNLFAFPVERGLVNPQDLSGFGEVGGLFQNFAKVRFLQLLHGDQRTDLQ